MKDLILIAMMLALIIFGYYIMTKVDRFIEENQRMVDDEIRNGMQKVRIAAENPMLLDSVSSALESCGKADGRVSFFLSTGRAGRILEKLLDEQVDIVLLTEEAGRQLDNRCLSFSIPYEQTVKPISVFGLSVDHLAEDGRICVVWKKNGGSKSRDRVLFILENEHCRLKCGYADYLN